MEQNHPDIGQNQKEDHKYSESIQNLSFTSLDNENQEGECQKEEENKQNPSLDKDQNIKIVSSNSVESKQSIEEVNDQNQKEEDNSESYFVKSPKTQQDENDLSSKKIQENIQNISNASNEQKSCLQKSFNQASQQLMKQNSNWITNEDEKKKDLFYSNVFLNPKFQMLSLGIFTLYIIFF